MSEPVAWLNGQVIPLSEAHVSFFDAGLVHGDAVTEMIRTFRHQPFRLDAHLERLQHSLDVALLESPYSADHLREAVELVVFENARYTPPEHDMGIIVFVTSGLNLTYIGRDPEQQVQPTVGVHTFPLPFELWADRYQTGQHLVVPDLKSVPRATLDPTAKVRSRIHWRIADRTVRRQFPTASAVLTDAAGNLTETSGGNLFCLIGGSLVTPPADDVLNGISRDTVLEIARTLNVPVYESDVTPAFAMNAEEIWTSSTPYCLLPVTRFNNQAVGNGKPGNTFRRFLSVWGDLVKVDIAAQMRHGATERLEWFQA